MSDPKKHLSFYLILMTLAGVLLFGIFQMGPSIESHQIVKTQELGFFEAIRLELISNLKIPVVGLIFQILIIILFSRLCALVLRYLGQPQVIGEMIAGILLGQSAFAYLWPSGFALVFPDSSMPRLYFLSQIGLIFFMFVVGLNLKISELKERGSAAVFISHVSIVVPFLLGAFSALFLYKSYGPDRFDFTSFALFMGIAMSITAFPVLARILEEKKMMGTPVGALALTCAAVDDVSAWCILAAVVGIVKAGTMASAVFVLVAALLYVVLMLKFVKPIVAKALNPATLSGSFSRGQLGFLFCVLLGSALVAEIIGVHALFGAFLAGVIMPQSVSFRLNLIEKIEDLTAVVLLPIFFAYTGIRTQVGLLNTMEDWLVCGGVIAVAIIGKLVGSALAARYVGMGWRESLALGSLMNTRGLMELVVLNIGYDMGLLSPTLFTMLVVMAIVTTFMTTPLLNFFMPQSRSHLELAPQSVGGART